MNLNVERAQQASGAVDVILPAGGRLEAAFAAAAGTTVKALIPIQGKSVLERTLDALDGVPGVRRKVVVGPEEVAVHPGAARADRVLPSGASAPENMFRALEWLREQDGGELPERVLVLTADLPFVTSAAISGFLAACPPEAAVSLPAVRRDEYGALFPDSLTWFVRLRDGEWAIGCAFLVRPAALLQSRLHLEQAFAARKSQYRTAALLGPAFILRLLLRRLGVQDIERRCEQLLGCSSRAVRGCCPTLAFDIDLPEHLQFARERAEQFLASTGSWEDGLPLSASP